MEVERSGHEFLLQSYLRCRPETEVKSFSSSSLQMTKLFVKRIVASEAWVEALRERLEPTISQYRETFYDTPSRRLTDQGYWLKKIEGESTMFVLKRVKMMAKNSLEVLVDSFEEHELDEKLASLPLVDDAKKLVFSDCQQFGSFDIKRYEWNEKQNEKKRTVRYDVCTFPLKDQFAVGSIVSSEPIPDESNGEVWSKMVEYLYRYGDRLNISCAPPRQDPFPFTYYDLDDALLVCPEALRRQSYNQYDPPSSIVVFEQE